jgi:hypothetical protein
LPTNFKDIDDKEIKRIKILEDKFDKTGKRPSANELFNDELIPGLVNAGEAHIDSGML